MLESLIIPPQSLQAVVVTTANWNSVNASLQRYERKKTNAPWVKVGQHIPAVVGKNGLAWGSSNTDQVNSTDNVLIKKEGDKKAPAGIFNLNYVFGDASADSVKWIKFPYQQMTSNIKCVDDPESKYYNTIVDSNKIKADWKSAEEMKRSDNMYSFGIVVDYNTNPTIVGNGSCIFLHIWREPTQGTAGCTAIDNEQMEQLLRWLNPNAKPIIIQLPKSEYTLLKTQRKFP